MIQCVSLDEAIMRFRPTLIKMDVEGAEYDALLGARKIITRYKPGLAICLYHRPEHLWQIPLLQQLFGEGKTIFDPATPGDLDSSRTNNSYRLYLRLHAFNGWELVAYAIPC